MEEAQDGVLAGRTILVVEDEFYLADDLTRALIEQGAEVAGPVNSLSRARALVSQERVDLAVLDVNLKGELVFPFAAELRERGVPFVFTTGYNAAMVPAEYQDVDRWEKPFVASEFVQAISKL